jgi:hypothetical protein
LISMSSLRFSASPMPTRIYHRDARLRLLTQNLQVSRPSCFPSFQWVSLCSFTHVRDHGESGPSQFIWSLLITEREGTRYRMNQDHPLEVCYGCGLLSRDTIAHFSFMVVVPCIQVYRVCRPSEVASTVSLISMESRSLLTRTISLLIADLQSLSVPSISSTRASPILC